MSRLGAEGVLVSRLGDVAGRTSRCWLLLALVLCLATAACAGGTAPGDTIGAPGPVTKLTVSATSIGDDWLSLSWTNPKDAYTGVTVRRSEGATAPTLTSGTFVADFNDQADYVVDPNLKPGTQYSYSFFAHKGNKYAAAATVTGRTTGTRATASAH
jgi:Fibronectin type III domain